MVNRTFIATPMEWLQQYYISTKLTQFAGPTKTLEIEAYELKSQAATSRHFVVGNKMILSRS